MPNWSADTLDEQLAKEPQRLAEINLALVYSGKSVREVREQYGYPEVGDGSIAWDEDNDQGVRWDRVFNRHAAKVRDKFKAADERAVAEYVRSRQLLERLSGKGWTADLIAGVSQVLLTRVLSGEMTFEDFRHATTSMNAASRAILSIQENERRNESHTIEVSELKRIAERAEKTGRKTLTPEDIAEIKKKVLGI